jgi:glycosyltransferase involved in cell wall biosynthesis
MNREKKKVLMMVENHYPFDPRVRKEALVLAAAGYQVTVIALRKKNQLAYEEINGVKVYRIPEFTLFEKAKGSKSSTLRKLFENLKSIIGYTSEYVYFTTASFLSSLYILAKQGFDVVHMHNPPDTLSMIGAFYRLLGKKYVFDHHDLSPELYLTRVSGAKDFVYKSMLFFEKMSCSFSNIIISTNESYRQIEIDRHSADPDKIFIVRNNPILSECTYNRKGDIPAGSLNGRKVLLFLGSINPQDGIDILLQALHYLAYELGEKNFICNIVGDGDAIPAAKELTAELKLGDFVDFKGMVFDRNKIKDYLCSADIGVEPAPCNDANEHSTFIKVMEFMAAGKPLVAFDLKETRYSADGAGLIIPPGDVAGFASAIKRLIDEPDTRQKMGQVGMKRIAENLNWEKASANLLQAYKSLFR